MKKGRDKVTIKIPRPLYENLGKIIEGGGFSCVTEFIVYVLRDLIASKSVEKEPALTREEIELVKKRLKSLNYL
jgi:metal-responsive CopG/Arc/MetJ family transcriptional regulator